MNKRKMTAEERKRLLAQRAIDAAEDRRRKRPEQRAAESWCRRLYMGFYLRSLGGD